MTFDTSQSAANAVLFSVLSLFLVLAVLTLPFAAKCIPERLKTLCCLSKGTGADSEKDHFLAARNSASATTIALSFFASGMGGWVLYGSPELGALPGISWIGVLGYAIGSAFPATVISYIGPRVRELTTDKKAFSAIDFARIRFGRVMQVVCALVSIFYMFIYIVAEMTGIAGIYGTIAGVDGKISVTIPLGVFTLFYTTLAGLPASIVTDKFQAVIIAILSVMVLISLGTVEENRVTSTQFAKASNWTADGLVVAVTLVIALLCAELFNQGNWQRVWAAESVPAMRKGFNIGALMVFLLMMFCGIMGMIAYAKDSYHYDLNCWDLDDAAAGAKCEYLSFFDVLEPLSNFWHVLVLVLVTSLAASSVDSLQNALSCIFSRDLVKLGWNPLFITRCLLFALNVPAVILGARGYDVISLFLIADIVCATAVLPLFMGLQTSDKLGGWLPAPTELGSFMGCMTGALTVIVNGTINEESNPFKYFLLQNGAACALCGTKTMVSFIITPIFSLIGTYLVSLIDISVRGERARQPIFHFKFDEEETDDEKGNESFHDNDD